jgi:hypothetical protein
MGVTCNERLLCGGPAGLRGAIRPGLDFFALLFVSRQKVEKTEEKTVRKQSESEEDLRVQT